VLSLLAGIKYRMGGWKKLLKLQTKPTRPLKYKGRANVNPEVSGAITCYTIKQQRRHNEIY